jgi:hypothetical protein
MPIMKLYPSMDYVEINRCEFIGESKGHIRYSGFFIGYNDPERFPTAEDRIFDFWFEIKLDDGVWKIYDGSFDDKTARTISDLFTAMYLFDSWAWGLEGQS